MRTTARLIGFVLATAALAPSSAAQEVGAAPEEIHFERLGRRQGLSSGQVTGLLQDSRGFVWFATSTGLNRYDGFEIIVYQHDPDSPPNEAFSITHNGVRGLHEGRDGSIWIGTFGGGLNQFDPDTDSFRRFRHDPNDASTIGQDLMFSDALWEDRDGQLWIGTAGRGLDRLDPQTGIFTHYRHNPGEAFSLSSDHVLSVLEDDEGAIWVGTRRGLNRLDKATGSVTRYIRSPDDSTALRDDYVFALMADRRGRLWVGTQNGLHRFDRDTGTFVRYEAPGSEGSRSREVLSLAEDAAGRVWIGTREGLFALDPPSNHLRRIAIKPSEVTSADIESIYDITEDRSGALWLATGDGVLRADRSFPRMESYRNRPGEINSLPNDEVWDVREDSRGNIWIATFGGLSRLDPARSTFTNYRHDSSEPRSISTDEIASVYEDRFGVIWAGGTNGLNRYDASADAFDRFLPDPSDPRSLAWTTAWRMCEDGRGNLWVATPGTGGGLNRFDRATNSFDHLQHDPLDPSSLSSDQVHTVLCDHEGVLWAGTWGRGLNRLDAATNTFTHYRHHPGDRSSLSNDFIASLFEDADRNLWIGTNGGLNRLDRTTGRIRHFTEQNSGLPGNGVSAIAQDDHGFLWIATSGGLARLDPRTLAFKSYPLYPGREIRRTRRGELMLCGDHGLLILRPETASLNRHAPRTVLTHFQLFGKTVRPSHDGHLAKSITSTREIRLAHNRNDVSFQIASLHFSDPSRNHHAHILEGFDDEWRMTGSRRIASYTNVPPGRYVFRARSANPDGVWDEEGVTLALIILPPWWQTWWFRIGAGLALLLTATGLYQGRMRRMQERTLELERLVAERTALVERQNNVLRAHETQLESQNRALVEQKAQIEEQARQLREMDELKSRFFANISHEFRTPLTLLLGPISDALDDEDGVSSMASRLPLMERNAKRLLALINQLLDLSRLEAGAMVINRRRGDLTAFIRAVVLAFTSRAEADEVALQFASDVETLSVPFDADKLEKVMYNLLSNAFKHTPKGGRIRVTVEQRQVDDRTYAVIVVRDNGEGIPREEQAHVFDRFYQVDSSATRRHEGSGIGLALARELVELHGGRIGVESDLGFGSVFTVLLPVHADVEEDGDEAEAAPAPPIRHVELPAPLPLSTDGMSHSEQGGRILVIEDNDDLRAYLRSGLQDEYAIAEAAHGVDGLGMARQTTPHLIISDVMMPGLDGFELCRRLRADPVLEDVPVILLTARTSEEHRIEGLAGGADDYICKPFSMAELRARIANLLRSRRQLRDRYSREVVLRPSDVAVPSSEAAFVEQLQRVTEDRMSDPRFTVEQLAYETGISSRHLHRRLFSLIGQTPSEFIRHMRMERAAQLLRQQSGTVAEVAYSVGFRSAEHFSRVFHQRFGVAPSRYSENGEVSS